MNNFTYKNVAIFLHWTIAALILTNIPLGITAANALSTGIPAELKRGGELLGWHKPIGLTVLILSLVWAAWRAAHPSPALPKAMPRWQKGAARISHATLYILLIAVPLSGWIYVSTSPWPITYFNLFDWPSLPLARVPRGNPLAGTIHDALGWAMAVVAAIHILAALYHQFLRGENLIARMLPSRSRTPETGA